jgi:hypothetical protein
LKHIFHLKITLLRSKASELSAGLREAWNNNPAMKMIPPDMYSDPQDISCPKNL